MSGYIARTTADDILEEGQRIGEERGLKKGEERGLKIGEERGLKKGEERGLKTGEKKGTVNATRLMDYLWRNNRGEDAVKAEEDNDYYQKLLKEYQETHMTPVMAEDAGVVLSE